MIKRSLIALTAALMVVAAIGVAQAGSSPSAEAQIRQLQLESLALAVDGDTEALRGYLSEDFIGINPLGIPDTREGRLGGIDAGAPDFLAIQPTTPIDVDVHGNHALVRYQVRIELTIFGAHLEHLMWDTLRYERRQGRWIAVWEQTTAVPNDVGLVVEALKKP